MLYDENLTMQPIVVPAMLWEVSQILSYSTMKEHHSLVIQGVDMMRGFMNATSK